MNGVVLAGRILFAILFVTSGFNHLTRLSMMSGYAKSRGLPAPKLAVAGSGIVILAGGLMVALGIYADLGSLLLAAFLVSAAFLMHGFWRDKDPQARAMEQVQFSKDLALLGASLALFAFFSHAGSSLGLTITGPLFHIN